MGRLSYLVCTDRTFPVGRIKKYDDSLHCHCSCKCAVNESVTRSLAVILCDSVRDHWHQRCSKLELGDSVREHWHQRCSILEPGEDRSVELRTRSLWRHRDVDVESGTVDARMAGENLSSEIIIFKTRKFRLCFI